MNSNLVVQSCLDYVCRCSRYFLCLLGERYGSHRSTASPALPGRYADLPPDADWLDRNFLVAASAGYDWILQDEYQHCSVTELEIQQVCTVRFASFELSCSRGLRFNKPNPGTPCVSLISTPETLSRLTCDTDAIFLSRKNLNAKIQKTAIHLKII